MPLADEIQGEFEPDEEEEAADVAEEVREVVALVAHGGGEVTGPVALDVVVLDVVVVVRVPRVAHQRIGDVGEDRVEEPEGLAEDPAHVDVLVHHEGVGADKVRLHDPVEDAMEPSEVVVEVESARDESREVDNEVIEHHDISLDADHLAGYIEIRLQQPFVCPWRQPALQVGSVPGERDGGLKPNTPRIIESFQLVYDHFFWGIVSSRCSFHMQRNRRYLD